MGVWTDPQGKERSRTIDPAREIQYESKWRLHVEPVFGRRMVKSIQPSEVAVWLTDLPGTYGPSTARSAFLVLNGCLELAVADELIERNPGQSKIVKRPSRRPSKVVAWSDDIVERIVEAHPERFRLLPTIGSAAGLPQGEMFGLSVDDFDFNLMLIKPGFTLQMYTHMLPSSYDRARQAVDRRLTRLALRLTDQSRTRTETSSELDTPDPGPALL